jgi:sporulation protein YlmC with PRC-barrel domain
MKIEDFIGMEVITGDARVLGNVEGVGIDIQAWKVPALKIGLRKGLEEPIGLKKMRFGSTTIFVNTDGVDSLSDMITLKPDLTATKEVILETENEIPTAGSIVDTRVVARGGRHIGYVDNFVFAPEKDWTITCMMVKLEKAVLSDLGLKKPRLGTQTIKILTEDIKTMGDMVMLKIDMKELKDHLDKKPRKRAIETTEVSSEPMQVEGSKLPFEVNDDYKTKYRESEDRKRKLENL